VGSSLHETGDLVTQDLEKAELLNVSFASVFTSKTGPQESQVLETTGKGWTKQDAPLVEEDQVRGHLSKLDILQSEGPDGMYPRLLRELAGVIVRPPSTILDQSWSLGEVPEDWRKANVTSKEDARNYRPASFTLTPGTGQLTLETIPRHFSDKSIARSHQRGMAKERPRFISWMDSCDGVTGT